MQSGGLRFCGTHGVRVWCLRSQRWVTAVKGGTAVEDNMLSGTRIRVVLAGDVDANNFVNIMDVVSVASTAAQKARTLVMRPIATSTVTAQLTYSTYASLPSTMGKQLPELNTSGKHAMLSVSFPDLLNRNDESQFMGFL
jgi:hypothetical protein